MTYTSPIICNAKTVLKRGDHGPAVHSLQARLKREDLDLAIDSSFGATTELAVKIYQAGQRLRADGIVGEKTWVQFTDSG